MADGTTYEIDIQARAIGADATASEVNALADAIDATAEVSSGFDAAIAAASAQLASASAASRSAAAELEAAEQEFGGLERAATKAAKAVERAAKRGKDTGELQRAADEAAAAVKRQAAAVDDARAAAEQASAAEKQLAGSLRTLQGAARSSAASARDLARGQGEIRAKGLELLAQRSPFLGQFNELAKMFGGGALKALALAAAVVVVVGAMVKLASAAASAVFGLIRFAVKADPKTVAGLTKASEQARESLEGLFLGVDTSPLVRGANELVQVFAEGTASGRALRTLLKSVLDPLISAAETAAPLLKEMWKGAVYGALQLAIGAVKVRNAILRAIPKETRTAITELVSGTDGLAASFRAGEVIFYVVAAAAAAVVVVFGVLAAAVGAGVAAFAAIVKTAIDFVKMLSAVQGVIDSAVSALGGLAKGAIGAAKDFVAGLVQGIKSGIGAVADAAKGLARGALDAVKSSLGIASRSKVMFQLAGYTAEGFTGGIEEATPRARRAVEAMVDVSSSGPGRPRSPLAALAAGNSHRTTVTSSQGGNTYHVTINAPSGDAEDIRAAFEEWLVSKLEASSAALGGGEVPAC